MTFNFRWIMYERIHSAERSFWLGFPSFLYLSCRLKKTSPCKAEWFGCLRHEQDHDLHHPHGYRGPFLQWTSGFDRAFPERDLHPQCITFCPPRNSKKQQEANHQFLTKTSPQTSPKQQKYLQYPQETLGLCFSQRPNTECLDACLLGGGGFVEKFRDWSLVWYWMLVLEFFACMVPGMIRWHWFVTSFVMLWSPNRDWCFFLFFFAPQRINETRQKPGTRMNQRN